MTIFRDQTYLQKHRFVERQISASPPPDLSAVVVIPCHSEPHLFRTLASLERCEVPEGVVEVIIVLNAGSHHEDAIHVQNESVCAEMAQWSRVSRKHTYHLLYFPQLPRKHAGVGLARKIGMDEAVDRLEQAGRPQAPIICLDADTTVAPNYLSGLIQWFEMHPKAEACSLHFEHPLEGRDFSPQIYEGIIRYELFLRYYIQALREAGYPYAYHTIGSAMAVRADAYQRRGGMNRRKAGEDFYFLHKFIPHGGFGELMSTCVYPSPRPSLRVPFGTGKAIHQWLDNTSGSYPAYARQTFQDLHLFIQQIPALTSPQKLAFPKPLQEFLDQEKWEEALVEIRKHSASPAAFLKRFYQWFDALKVLKFVHYARDHHYPDEPVERVAAQLYEELNGTGTAPASGKELLFAYREWQR